MLVYTECEKGITGRFFGRKGKRIKEITKDNRITYYILEYLKSVVILKRECFYDKMQNYRTKKTVKCRVS